jgi:hypothetical protein
VIWVMISGLRGIGHRWVDSAVDARSRSERLRGIWLLGGVRAGTSSSSTNSGCIGLAMLELVDGAPD